MLSFKLKTFRLKVKFFTVRALFIVLAKPVLNTKKKYRISVAVFLKIQLSNFDTRTKIGETALCIKYLNNNKTRVKL